MIYIVTALYCEAHIFIEQFHLKKVMGSSHFQQFRSESAHILLIVSGVGEIAAASAVSSVCTEYKPGKGDFLVNVGICADLVDCAGHADYAGVADCAGVEKKQGIFLMHKLVEQATKKTFYPDILYRHPFKEASLVTGMVPWEGHSRGAAPLDATASDTYFYDMEAAAIYQAGAYFFGPHQMAFLKIVSDSGEGDRLEGEFVQRLMEMHKGSIFAFLAQLTRIGQETANFGDPLEPQVQESMEQLCADLHCSKAMGDSLRQHVRYAMLAGIDYGAVVQELYRENRLPCKDKREGKRCLEELKRRLL